jgi:uncharacterized protein YkwD
VKYVLSLGLFFMLVACGETPLVTSKSIPSGATEDMQRLLVLVNEVRATGYVCDEDLKFDPAEPLTLDTKLMTAAYKHSVDLDAAGVTVNMHVTPQGAVNYEPGTKFTGRIELESYKWAAAGENVAFGFNSPERVMQAWLESPGHCKNILNPKFSELGLGRAGTYWTQVFAAPL